MANHVLAFEISGSVQRGVELSSSAALEVALILAIITLTDAPGLDRMHTG